MDLNAVQAVQTPVFTCLQTMQSGSGARKRSLPSDMQGAPNGTKRQGVEQELQLRILCPSPRIGSVIGKGGQVVQALRSETGARIRVDGTVYGCNERVVVIGSKDLEPVQEALLRVLDKVYEEDLGSCDATQVKATIRYLVDAVQIGAILGKGGSIISELRQQSGAQIKVLQGHDLPLCALPTDEVVQINGDYNSAVSAAQLVVERLKEAPRRTRAQSSQSTPLGMASAMLVPSNMSSAVYGVQALPQVAMTSAVSPVGNVSGTMETTFRLLVPERHTGSIIGKGGEVIRRIRDETGAKVIIYDTVEGCDERVLKCRSVEEVSAAVCPAQEAMTRALLNLFRNEDPSPRHIKDSWVYMDDDPFPDRIRWIHRSIRRETGAVLIVQPREQLPACSQESDELFELRGTLHQIIPAFQTVCQLLRANMMRSQAKSPGEGISTTPTAGAAKVAMLSPEAQNALAMQPASFGIGVIQRSDLLSAQNAGLAALTGIDVASPGTLNIGQQLGFVPEILKITVRLLLTSKQAGAVIGKGGNNIRQINQMSGAKCKVKDPSENGDREMEISGTAEQAQAAQSLVNAFLLAGNLPTQVRLLVSSTPGMIEDPRGIDPTMGAMLGTQQVLLANHGVANPALAGGMMGMVGAGTPQLTHLTGTIANPLALGMTNVMYQQIKPE